MKIKVWALLALTRFFFFLVVDTLARVVVDIMNHDEWFILVMRRAPSTRTAAYRVHSQTRHLVASLIWFVHLISYLLRGLVPSTCLCTARRSMESLPKRETCPQKVDLNSVSWFYLIVTKAWRVGRGYPMFNFYTVNTWRVQSTVSWLHHQIYCRTSL